MSRMKRQNVVRSTNVVVRLGDVVVVGWVVYLCTDARQSTAQGVRHGVQAGG